MIRTRTVRNFLGDSAMTGVRGGVTVALAVGGAVTGGASTAVARTGARGPAARSTGVGWGDPIQVPVRAPVGSCGKTLGVVGVLDSASGDTLVDA
ncbi:chaplin family protein [Streptomyces sp. NPDC093249]|uniref:chaplin family protein n=1 Tax=unclassified Streptomyces TaxID=2593676 RepID=UPI00380DF453